METSGKRVFRTRPAVSRPAAWILTTVILGSFMLEPMAAGLLDPGEFQKIVLIHGAFAMGSIALSFALAYQKSTSLIVDEEGIELRKAGLAVVRIRFAEVERIYEVGSERANYVRAGALTSYEIWGPGRAVIEIDPLVEHFRELKEFIKSKAPDRAPSNW